MATTSGKSNANKGKGSKKSHEEVLAGFQSLRQEQRQIANKISELEMDLNEHKIVIDTLRGVEGTRRCFRMVGGVLVERTVSDLLPDLEANTERLPQAIAALNEQLGKKGAEINDYIEKHEIRVQRNSEPEAAPASDQQTKSNVLVASG